jgi:hypothetical protein
VRARINSRSASPPSTVSELDFADLVTLIKGSSISSLAIADDFFELGLTDAFNLRIYGQIGVELISTLNKGELPPVRLRILSDKEDATAQAVEKHIHALRQLHAATFLVNAGRANDIYARTRALAHMISVE